MESMHPGISEAIKAMRGVVRIHVEGYTETNAQSILDPRFAIPLQWTGSGFFIKINGAEGYILTNAHVARNATSLQCMSLLTSEEYFQLELVGLVETLEPDIALLRMPPEECERYRELAGCEIPHLELCDTDSLHRGLEIKAIGYPMGMAEPNISGGELSNFISGDISYSERLVTDAAINPGNSGGPAILPNGLVAGLNTATISEANNIGFVTPAAYCRLLMENLLHAGQARLTHLGSPYQKNSDANARYLGMKKAEGIILTKPFKKGTVSSAGLKKWDVLMAVNEHKLDRHGIVRNPNHWAHHTNAYDLLRNYPVGEELELSYWRDGKKQKVTAKALPMPSLRLKTQPIVGKRRFLILQGMLIQEVSYEILAALSEVYDLDQGLPGAGEVSDRRCLIITHIVPGSPGDYIELEIGDLLHKINGKNVSSLKDLQRAVKRNKDTSLVVQTRSGRLGVFPSEQLERDDSRILRVAPS